MLKVAGSSPVTRSLRESTECRGVATPRHFFVRGASLSCPAAPDPPPPSLSLPAPMSTAAPIAPDDLDTADPLDGDLGAADPLDGDLSAAVPTAADEPEPMKIDLAVEDAGPCLKHVRVTVPREELDRATDDALVEFAETAQVPGFRVGRVPAELIRKRFREELSGQVKQRVLMDSLEQVSARADIEPINEPDLDPSALEIPEEGDFEYEFDVEVRPHFDLPDYAGLKIERPAVDTSPETVAAHREKFLMQYGRMIPTDAPAESGDVLTLSAVFRHRGEELHEIEQFDARLRPVLRFTDAELEGFDKLFAGAEPGDTREATLTISPESERVELRGEEVAASFAVQKVRRLELPTLTRELLDRIGVESEAELEGNIRDVLERQGEFRRRQLAREQILEKITASADWELPEKLVRRQTENALRREILEMQQAGFTSQEIRVRENQLKQNAVSATRQALKEHFILDRVAEEHDLEPSPSEVEAEIQLMAMQRGEPVRRVRSRLHKSGMIDNLAAQLRERKAIDVLLEKAEYVDVPATEATPDQVEAVDHSVLGLGAIDPDEELDELDEGYGEEE